MDNNIILKDTKKINKVHIYKYQQEFLLECGQSLSELDIAYCTYGRLNEEGDNVIWICHALTANSDASDWWNGLIGQGKLFDPAKYFIVCANILGSCYGATCPSSINPKTGLSYHINFPLITIGDIVRSHQIICNHLNINLIQILIGGSIGGQQVLEWAIQEPKFFHKIIPIATNAKQSPWAIAFNESQRMAMEADPTLFSNQPNAGHKGLEAARAIAMISYRNYITYEQTQKDTQSKLKDYRASAYQKYQGIKLRNRFEPLAYYYLLKSMDTQDVGRNRGGFKKALNSIIAKTLVLGINTDVLFPLSEQLLLAKYIKGATFKEIKSDYGHDGFLIEYAQLEKFIGPFLRE